MCLDTVDRTYEGTSNRVIDAWGVFRTEYPELPVVPGALYHGFRTPCAPLVQGKWLVADPAPLVNALYPGANRYRAGFHKFAKHFGATDWKANTDVVRRVRLRGLLAVGTQGGHKVYVAREMFIPKQPKERGNRGRTTGIFRRSRNRNRARLSSLFARVVIQDTRG